MEQAWLEESLHSAELHPPIQASKYDEVARLHAIYSEVSRLPGWADYLSRMRKMRTGITSEILTGSLDKFGASRDSEKRAVLAALDRLLAFVPALHRQYEELDKKRRERELKAQRKTGIHGEDVLSVSRTSDPPSVTAQRVG